MARSQLGAIHAVPSHPVGTISATEGAQISFRMAKHSLVAGVGGARVQPRAGHAVPGEVLGAGPAGIAGLFSSSFAFFFPVV